jgi:hypothetical protein
MQRKTLTKKERLRLMDGNQAAADGYSQMEINQYFPLTCDSQRDALYLAIDTKRKLVRRLVSIPHNYN